MACYRVERDGIVLFVRLTPRGGRDAIQDVGTLADGREVLRARVRAVPEGGAANAALEALLARYLSTPRSAVRIVSGLTARVKEVRVTGDPVQLAAIVEAARGG